MLQWMGGSRRKVTTSRASTNKRQKQYFEQKKRQQQTAGIYSTAEETHACNEYQEKPKSLDILSLLNLSKVVQERKSENTNVANTSDRSSQPSNVPSASLLNKSSPLDSDIFKQNKSKLSCDVENVPPIKVSSITPDKLPSPCNYPFHKNDAKFDHDKGEKEQYQRSAFSEVSVLELLGDDGPNTKSERSSVQEAHVSFAVEGLGKIGMETPVHSPRQSSRVSYNGLSSSSKTTRRRQPSKVVKNIMNDLELELKAMVHNTDVPPADIERQFMEHCTSERFMLLDGDHYPVDNFFGEKACLYNNFENHEMPMNDKFGFKCEISSDEETHDVAWKRQPHNMTSNFTGSWRYENQNTFNFSFEDSYRHSKRNILNPPIEFDFSGPSGLHFEELGNDYNLVTSTAAGHSSEEGSWDFYPPSWSYFPKDDTKNTMCMLSEESCSSTAERCEKANHAASNRMKLGCSLCRGQEKNSTKKTIYAEETVFMDQDERQQQKTRVFNSSVTRPLHHENTVMDNGESKYNWLFQESNNSSDIDMCLDSIHSSFTELDDVLEYPSCDLFPNIHSSHKRSKFDPVKYGLSESFFIEQSASKRTLSPVHSCVPSLDLNSRSKTRKSNTFQEFRVEDKHSFSSHVLDSRRDEENVVKSSRYFKEKVANSEGQSNDPLSYKKSAEDPEKEGSVGNNDPISDNGTVVLSSGSKDNYSDRTEMIDENPVLVEMPETQVSVEHEEVYSNIADDDIAISTLKDNSDCMDTKVENLVLIEMPETQVSCERECLDTTEEKRVLLVHETQVFDHEIVNCTKEAIKKLKSYASDSSDQFGAQIIFPSEGDSKEKETIELIIKNIGRKMH